MKNRLFKELEKRFGEKAYVSQFDLLFTAQYYKFMGWLTRYYPFSLLYQNRLFHAKNAHLTAFMTRLEEIVKEADGNILLFKVLHDEGIAEFSGILYGKMVNKKKKIREIEKVLQDKLQVAYVRYNHGLLHILIPTEDLDKYIESLI